MNNQKTSGFQISLLGVLLTTSACTQTAFVAANLPTHFDETVVVQDRAYGPDPAQKLDIYIPADNTKQPLEVVVFFYGGRWTYGAKENYRFVGSTFADRGFLVVIPDYRKYPQVRFPVFVEDGAKALSWVYDHIAESHGNPTRIHVVGHSAGAHVGALVTADPRYLADEGKDRSIVIHDFAGLAGPYAFTPDEPDLEDMFGPPQKYPNMQVTTFIDGTQPPMLLLHGERDLAVKYTNVQKLQQQIVERGGCVRSHLYPDVNHTDLIRALSWLNQRNVSVADDITKFFDSCGQAATE